MPRAKTYRGAADLVAAGLAPSGTLRELEQVAARYAVAITPAMASGLTDHVWSVSELLCYRRTPAALPLPKRGRGRPKKQVPSDPSGASLSTPMLLMDRKEAPVASTS